MKQTYYTIIAYIIALFMNSSCSEDNVTNYYTFTGETIGNYLENRPDEFSELLKLLKSTNTISLFNAYGEYTCFAPNNKAFHEYYKEKEIKDIEDLSMDEKLKLVYNHIIKGYILKSNDFSEGRLSCKTMSDRFITITFKNIFVDNLIYVNKNSAITDIDNKCHNGIIHHIDNVLSPTDLYITEVLKSNDKFSLFSKALELTKINEKLYEYEDLNYNYEDYKHLDPVRIPRSRKFGYTIFVESDSLYKQKYGITDIEGLISKAKEIYDPVYKQDKDIDDITDPRNSLNRYISYHILNKQMNKKMFVEYYASIGHLVEGREMCEYVETLCENTMIEFKHKTSTETNIINQIGNDGNYITLTDDFDNDALNGVYHEVNDILAYSLPVVSELSSKRLRMDVISFFPEMFNNGYKACQRVVPEPKIPPGYIERFEFREDCRVHLWGPWKTFSDYQGDEFLIYGNYDFTVTTSTIPSGTYEVRLGYQTAGGRGIAQVYWDGLPCGIPVDFSMGAANPKIGWVQPNTDQEDWDGFENDKMMRNRGYMKGGSSYKAPDGWAVGSKINARMCQNNLRKILGIFSFEKPSTHKFRVKSVKEGEFMLDFLEFTPTEVIENEDVY